MRPPESSGFFALFSSLPWLELVCAISVSTPPAETSLCETNTCEFVRHKGRSQSSLLTSDLAVGERLGGGWREKEEAASEANAARLAGTGRPSRRHNIRVCIKSRFAPHQLSRFHRPTRVSVPRSSGKVQHNGVSVRIRAGPARAVVHFSQHHRAGSTGSAARAEGSERTPAIRRAPDCAQSTSDGRMGAISPDPPWHGGTGRYRHTASSS